MSDKPEFTIRDGAIKATVWRNQGEKGDFFTASFSRTYRDEETGQLRDANTFTGSDLLKVSTLAQEAYQQARALRQEQKVERQQGEDNQSAAREQTNVRTRRRERSRGSGRER